MGERDREVSPVGGRSFVSAALTPQRCIGGRLPMNGCCGWGVYLLFGLHQLVNWKAREMT